MQAFDLFRTRWFVYFAIISVPWTIINKLLTLWLTDDSAPQPRELDTSY